jgi:DNA-binding CsgD family transcriptional regulator
MSQSRTAERYEPDPAPATTGRGIGQVVAHFGERHGLSVRERLVVLLAAQGHSTKETSLAMECEQGTVNVYWSRIRRKTGLISRGRLFASLLDEALSGATGRP